LKDDQTRFSTSIADNLFQLFSLKGRTALVTGAASGIGKRIGSVLVAAGGDVYFGDIDEAGAHETAQEANAIGSGRARHVQLDVTDPGSVKNAFGRISKEAEGVEILVCSAGVSRAKWIDQMTLKMWNMVLDVNLTGTFLCCKEAARSMVPRRWGRIINIASIAATHAPKPTRFDGGYNYSASKAGVIGMTKRLAVELAPYSITVNSISPGIMETPLTAKALAEEETLKQVLDSVPMRRIGKPSDLDGLSVFLCSESSAFLTGQDILVDGGYSVW
jgi:NAD(P)-dependent dehydrogenase (short-subunit alcohol dehydrogenase family)